MFSSPMNFFTLVFFLLTYSGHAWYVPKRRRAACRKPVDLLTKVCWWPQTSRQNRWKSQSSLADDTGVDVLTQEGFRHGGSFQCTQCCPLRPEKPGRQGPRPLQGDWKRGHLGSIATKNLHPSCEWNLIRQPGRK